MFDIFKKINGSIIHTVGQPYEEPTEKPIEQQNIDQLPTLPEQQTIKEEEVKEKSYDNLIKTNDIPKVVKKVEKYRFEGHRKRRNYARIDNEIMTALGIKRLLTTSAIAELTGLNTKYAIKHLLMLEERGLVSRFQKGTFKTWNYWTLPKKEFD